MIRLVFPDVDQSPEGRSPLALRIRLDRRPSEPGGVVIVLYKHRGGELTAADMREYAAGGAFIETDDERAARQLLEALGPDAPIRRIRGER